jgi:hypothetical protein
VDGTPSQERHRLREVKELLACVSIIRSACDLDLLVFFFRHPRSLLTSEQIAVFLGYEMNHVAHSIDAFIAADFLRRTQHRKHAGRLYLLALNGSEGGGGLNALLKLALTRQGRQDILEVLNEGQSRTG